MKILMGLLVFLGSVLISGIAIAADLESGSNLSSSLIPIGSGIAVGLATFGATYALGKASSAALEGITRNPTSSSNVFMPLILSLALIEFQGILGFIIAFLWYIK